MKLGTHVINGHDKKHLHKISTLNSASAKKKDIKSTNHKGR
jgi:hypothetical protein